jgi:hypothetical protein
VTPSDSISSVYEFVYRGLLTEEALDVAGRTSRYSAPMELSEITQSLSLELFEDEFIGPAQLMSIVYMAIAAFENSVRRFIYKVLIDKHGENWWEQGVSAKIRTFAEDRRAEEEKTKWHGTRGEDLLSYTELKHLPDIISQNWDEFEPYVRRQEWAVSIFAVLERSRNIIMHSGVLELSDVERVGINMRDWNKQVGL